MVSDETQSFVDSFLVQLYLKNIEDVELCLVNIMLIMKVDMQNKTTKENEQKKQV